MIKVLMIPYLTTSLVLNNWALKFIMIRLFLLSSCMCTFLSIAVHKRGIQIKYYPISP